MIRLALALAVAVATPSIAQTVVTKDANPTTPVPLEAPHAYALTPPKQQAIRRTRREVAQRHDRAWADRERRAIHQERGVALRAPTP